MSDNYIAWMRWVGDTQYRYPAICDSDTPGAFKVYRNPDTELVSLIRTDCFQLCESTEEHVEPDSDFNRGRIFEAKHIRNAIGDCILTRILDAKTPVTS